MGDQVVVLFDFVLRRAHGFQHLPQGLSLGLLPQQHHHISIVVALLLNAELLLVNQLVAGPLDRDVLTVIVDQLNLRQVLDLVVVDILRVVLLVVLFFVEVLNLI